MAEYPDGIGFEINRYYLFFEDTFTHDKCYSTPNNSSDDPKIYSFNAGANLYASPKSKKTSGIGMERILAWFVPGHSYNYYLVYAPVNPTHVTWNEDDILDTELRTRNVSTGELLETVKLRDVISESGVYIHQGSPYDSSAFTTLDNAGSSFVSL